MMCEGGNMEIVDQPEPEGGSGDVLLGMLEGGDVAAAEAAASGPLSEWANTPAKVAKLALIAAAGVAQGLGVDLGKAVAERRKMGPIIAGIGNGKEHAALCLRKLIDAAAYATACDLADCAISECAKPKPAEWAELEGDDQEPFVDAASGIIDCLAHGDMDEVTAHDTVARYLYRVAMRAAGHEMAAD